MSFASGSLSLFESLFGFRYGESKSKAQRITDAQNRAARSNESYPSYDTLLPSSIALPSSLSSVTSLSKAELIDKIRGIIYGNAIGDAVGLYTEFMSKRRSYELYGNQDILLDVGVRGWDAGDWTDDTDQLILILDGLLRHGGRVEPCDFSSRLRIWVSHGFAELGDFCGNGCGGVVASAVRSPLFLTNPHEAALRTYLASDGWAAANGAVMRTAILGIPNFDDEKKVIENTKLICKTTHADPRCVASTVLCTTAIAALLRGEKDIEAILEHSRKLAEKELEKHPKEEEYREELRAYCSAKQIEDLQLDESRKIGYTYKCIASGVYCLRYLGDTTREKEGDFHSMMKKLILEGGDADTNGSVAGAMMGAKVGYKQLPKVWLERLLEKEWLEKKLIRLLKLMGLDENEDTSAASAGAVSTSSSSFASVP